MAELLDDIVKVTIDRQTAVASMKSFNELLIADEFDPSDITPVFDASHRIRVFGDPDEVLDAGFATDSYIYRAFLKLFSQSPHINRAWVGLKLPTDATWFDALGHIKKQNNVFYGVTTSAREMLEQQQVAQWIQANKKLGIIASGDPDIVDEDSGDFASWAKLNNLDRVVPFYHPDCALVNSLLNPNDPIPDVAYFAKMLTKHPGSPTWKFKDMQAVPTFELDSGQYQRAMNKNATIYCSVADLPMTFEGKVAAGEYIDVMHGCDWLESLIQTLIFTKLKQEDKVSFTNSGIALVVGELQKALDRGVKCKLLAGYDIGYPDAADVSPLEKGKRLLPDITFEGPLDGAIHAVQIKGVVKL